MRRALLLPAPLLLLCACAARPLPEPPLAGVRAWAIQLHGYEREGAVERLATSPYELLVLDAAARPVAGKLCLAYVNVGQAESYRPYWKAFWRAPAAGAGVPDYLLAADPQGWQGNYVVAYWDPRWQALLWGGRGGQVDEAIAAGFDGVFLDWVLGARDLAVTAAARRQGVDAERAMAGLVRDLAAYARSRRPGFLVVANNGALLAARFPGMRRALDAVVQESLTYGGRAGAAWEDGDAGGLAPSVSPETRAALASVGLPVFTLDYAVLEDDARTARAASLARGFVPFVSRTSLDRLP